MCDVTATMAWPFVGVESVLYHKRRWMGVYLFTLSVAIAGVVFAIVNAYENRPVIRQYISVQEAIDRGGSLGDKYQCRCTERTPSEFSAIKACALEEGCDVSSLYGMFFIICLHHTHTTFLIIFTYLYVYICRFR